MSYTVTFYALRDEGGEAVVTVHRVEEIALPAYTMTPEIALMTTRQWQRGPQADGFRVANAEGRILLDYRDRVG